MKCQSYDLFWDFFRDFDLQNRARIMNASKPDLSVILHYNVDEKNAPWKQFSGKNFTMAFIGGGFTASNLSSTEMKLNFLRLLITGQLDSSAALSAQVVKQFNTRLGIPIARGEDAKYLRENSLATPSPGVFSRNLLLCRQVNSVLVYGEALYQDNAQEAAELMKLDFNYHGIQTNQRLLQVAEAYFEGIRTYLKP